MGDPTKGFYDKFYVTRTDGDPKGKHPHCTYFVLDLDHDPHAKAVIAAYEESCQGEYPFLAADLRGWLKSRRIPRERMPPPTAGVPDVAED